MDDSKEEVAEEGKPAGPFVANLTVSLRHTALFGLGRHQFSDFGHSHRDIGVDEFEGKSEFFGVGDVPFDDEVVGVTGFSPVLV